jgi:hypothetical protein
MKESVMSTKRIVAHRWLVGLFALVITLAGVSNSFAEASTELPLGESRPVSELLNPDGTVNLATGYSGTLDISGFEMTTDASGAPRFVQSGGETMAGPTLANPHTANPDDHWASDSAPA